MRFGSNNIRGARKINGFSSISLGRKTKTKKYVQFNFDVPVIIYVYACRVKVRLG